MAELENEEVNRELCALAIEDMIDSWSPETQEQFLAEWNDWQKDGETIGFSCAECSKVFTRLSPVTNVVNALARMIN